MRGLQMVSLYPKLTDNLEGHVLEGRKIHLRSRPPTREMLSWCSVEGGQEEEVQAPKREKIKNKRAGEREAQYQFSREKAFLQRKLRELGPVPGGGASLPDKKKAQALELSTKDNCLKSDPRVPRGNIQTLAQDESAKETTRKQPKMEKRKLRTEWWDPTLWGDPVTLTKREQSPHKTCSRFQSDPWKPSFPIGRLSYKNAISVPRED
ncbi:coiled-coil domain-containing protein [Microtus ochrogaster]|uniref:Coiled-coil domain-containing protein n=1 Tax=Microtus ochrogaster TaxID=79684 RepID=A0A8J6KN07_MICOH|nr:coiled-coil domain-containing protein [Microtus ochrogaster]